MSDKPNTSWQDAIDGGWLPWWLDPDFWPNMQATQEEIRRIMPENSIENDLRVVVEIGKRMRAMQIDYFKTRNLQTLRTCKALETEFDHLLERIDQELWTRTQP